MLFYELVEAVAVAGLQKYRDFALAFRYVNEVFGQVRAAEVVVDELREAVDAVERGRAGVVCKFAFFPGYYLVYRAGRKQFLCFLEDFIL